MRVSDPRLFPVGYLLLLCTMLSMSGSSRAQAGIPSQPAESDDQLLLKAEADISLIRGGDIHAKDLASRAYASLRAILRRVPDSPLRIQILDDLKSLNEILGDHNLAIARFYMDQRFGTSSGAEKGAESRLRTIVTDYPTFSRMDEVFSRLALLARLDQRPGESTDNLWTLVCNYPNSRFVQSAFAQLNEAGSNNFEGCEKYTRGGR